MKDAIVSNNSSIKETMCAIDASGFRVAYIVDEKKRVIGVASDSEIRRAILKGMDIKQTVKCIINPRPVLLKESELSNRSKVKRRIQTLLERMPDSRYILVIDANDMPLKFMPCSELSDHKDSCGDMLKASGKNILVVGGAGYLGSVLVRKLLVRGFKVKVLDILMYGSDSLKGLLESDKFEFIEGDMRNISTLVRALDSVDAVINLAAIVGDPACKNKPEMAIETNYLANKALAEACKYHQINRFIYASTCSVYGFVDGDRPLDENSPLNPLSLYARSKIHSEDGILSLADENFSPTILRMGTLYGYSYRMRFDLVVNAMVKTAVVEKKISVHGGGKQRRPLLNVEDAAEAYFRCLEAPLEKIKGGIFNVGSDAQNYKIIDISRIVNKCVPYSRIIIEDTEIDSRNYLVSFAKIKKQLKYTPQHTLENSINRLKKAIEKGEIEDLNNPNYYNSGA